MTDDNHEIECQECGHILTSEDIAYDVHWREDTPDDSLVRTGDLWLCKDCMTLDPER